MTALPPFAFAPGKGALAAHIETALGQFGASRLSDREAEVARLILQGHSSKVIARRLGNSPETVKVFRKRIHTKLGLASSAELFLLFLAALSAAPQNCADDPLIHLPLLS
ncbi:MAG: helix-turn-helix transcriptional regulator [Rhodobacterales bacterium]|nr:helix-turn-helix transcriptional regulator [Rhodobacterales bacterium]